MTIRLLQRLIKEAVLVVSQNITELNKTGKLDLVFKIGLMMLKYDVYPSVYFVSDIWTVMTAVVS